MFADCANTQSVRSAIHQKAKNGNDEQSQPEEGIVEAVPLRVSAESRNAWRIRGACKSKLQKESRYADREQVDRDSRDDLVSPISDRCNCLKQTEDQSADHSA